MVSRSSRGVGSKKVKRSTVRGPRVHRVTRYKNEVCFLSTCKPSQRRAYLKTAPSGVVHAIGDIANTVLRGNLDISDANRTKLRRQQSLLKSLSSRKTSVATKRRLLSQRGGSFLGVLWNAIKSILN